MSQLFIICQRQNRCRLIVSREINIRGYYAALLAHEKGHGQFGIDMAEEIERTFRKMKYSGDCEVFSASANKKAYEILEKYKRMDNQYDRQTGHGKTEGAYLN